MVDISSTPIALQMKAGHLPVDPPSLLADDALVTPEVPAGMLKRVVRWMGRVRKGTTRSRTSASPSGRQYDAAAVSVSAGRTPAPRSRGDRIGRRYAREP